MLQDANLLCQWHQPLVQQQKEVVFTTAGKIRSFPEDTIEALLQLLGEEAKGHSWRYFIFLRDFRAAGFVVAPGGTEIN